MDCPKLHDYFGPKTLALLFLFMAAILYLSVSSSSNLTSQLFSFKPGVLKCPVTNLTTAGEAPLDELEAALAKASMENKTVIIAVINKAYADEEIGGDSTMLDLFLRSFWLGEDTRPLLNHLLLVAVDQTAYERCQFLKLNCYKLETDGVDFAEEKLYMSPGFLKMMWRRTWFLLEVLKRGYSFIFTDTDVVWLRNPFLKLSNDENEDMQISTDRYFGNPWSEKNLRNTGFYFVRSNNKTITLFDKWYSKKDNSPGVKEQDALTDLIRGGIARQLGLKVRYLDTLFFSGFCQDSRDFRAVATVHANCCLGINAKVGDLSAVLRDWKNFKVSYKKAEALNQTANFPYANFRWTRHLGCQNSWRRN